MKILDLFEAQATTNWTVINTIKNILGDDLVATSNPKEGQYLVIKGDYAAFGKTDNRDPYDWEIELNIAPPNKPEAGTIEVPDLNSRDARFVAMAAHEAFHAFILSKSPKTKLFRNEKYVNQLATKWVKKNITGMALHVALETILQSKIDYGHN